MDQWKQVQNKRRMKTNETKKTNQKLYRGDDGYDEGLKLTEREYSFGSNYQWLYEYTTGVIDGDGNPYSEDIPEGLNTASREKIKEEKEWYCQVFFYKE